MQVPLSADLRAIASQAFQHQAAGRYAEAAQGYLAVLSRAPDAWPTCYNLGLVYQHLRKLPEAVKAYQRATYLNPALAEAHNNLGNVFKALENHGSAIDAYRRAISLKPQLSEASYNLATMLQARGEHSAANDMFRQTIAHHPTHLAAWDALYRSLLGLRRHEEAINVFIAWEAAMPPCPELVTAGLALCRPIGNPAMEARYLAFALDWPFAEFTPEQYVPVLGMIQYFDVTREQLLACYQRYDAVVALEKRQAIALLPRRAADSRLRIGYLSADFRQHVMGRWMLEVIKNHDREHVSIYLISTCPPNEFDGVTEKFRALVDGFADISALDDFAAAKTIAEVDLDILVDLAGHTMAARPVIYAFRPARNIITHLGYHGCLGLRAVDFKLTDAIADPFDADQFQIEQPFPLDGCVFPFVRVAPAAAETLPPTPNLAGKFVFAAFTAEIKLSPRCLAVWARVLTALPEAVLLFSPLSTNQHLGIARLLANAGIDSSRIAFLDVPPEDARWRARYRLTHAVLDTFPYAGGDTTLAALDMGVPVVTLKGHRHSERVGASILTHLNLTETIAEDEDNFVALAVRLARDPAFMAETKRRIAAAVGATDVNSYTQKLETAYRNIVAKKPAPASMQLTARDFFNTFRAALKRHQHSPDEQLAATYRALRAEQPDYAPLLRAQSELAQTMGNIPLAAECANALLRQFPDDVAVRISSAGFLIDDSAPEAAIAVLEPLASTALSNHRVAQLLTRAHAKLGQWARARTYSSAAIALAATDADIIFWHGMVLVNSGEAAAALSCLNRALILKPDHPAAAYNAGVILAELGNLRDAETVFRRALGVPASSNDATVRVATHLRLLHLLWSQGRHGEWAAMAQNFTDAYPDAEQSPLILARLARMHGDLAREAALLLPLAEAATMQEDDALAAELIGELLATLCYHDVPHSLLSRLRARYLEASRVRHPADERPPSSAGVALRLGYLVDFSQPFMVDLITQFLAHHPPHIHAIVYALSPTDPALEDALRASATPLIAVAAYDERHVAGIIQADHLDVLIDAAGFGRYAKPGCLSHRLARVQLALPGFTHPTSIGELDYRLSDIDAEVDSGGTPAPLMVDGCAFPLLPANLTPLMLSRETLGIAPHAPLLGILAAAAQLSARCLTTWKTLADRLPNAVFFVCPLSLADGEPVKRLLIASGIEATRIHALPVGAARPRDLDLSTLLDVILDPMPGSDYFSARAAIQGAIPIVTMSGRLFEERVARTLLMHLGDTGMVAESGRDYVDIAMRLAADKDKYVDILRALKADSPLIDIKNYLANVEAALIRVAANGTSV